MAGDIAGRITAIRDKWHTKQHPMFQAMAKGELNLRVLGVYMAQHAKYVRHGLEAFGLMYSRAPADVRKMLAENMAEEEGLIGGHTDHGAHDHMQMIYDFCDVAGMTKDEVRELAASSAKTTLTVSATYITEARGNTSSPPSSRVEVL